VKTAFPYEKTPSSKEDPLREFQGAQQRARREARRTRER